MDKVDRLTAIEEIKTLKARYFRGVDTKDWDLVADTFAVDIVVDFRSATTDQSGFNAVPVSTSEVMRGRDAAIPKMRDSIKDVATVHHGHMPEIEILDDTNARGVWAMYDLLSFPPGAPIAGMAGYGHYHETYVRTAEGWKIATLRLSRLRLDWMPAAQ